LTPSISPAKGDGFGFRPFSFLAFRYRQERQRTA
jgi:hypothetical protein